MKLFPLWVWEERFREEWGKKPVPAMNALPSAAVREGTGFGLALGSGLAAAGAIAGSATALAWGLRLAAVGGALFLFNFARTARWALLPLAYHPRPEDVERHEAVVRAVRQAREREAGPANPGKGGP
jgi:hypothetical protein